jgi:hypothetical protein
MEIRTRMSISADGYVTTGDGRHRTEVRRFDRGVSGAIE